MLNRRGHSLTTKGKKSSDINFIPHALLPFQTAISPLMGIRSGMKFSFYTPETEFLDVYDHMEPWSGFRLVISEYVTNTDVGLVHIVHS